MLGHQLTVARFHGYKLPHTHAHWATLKNWSSECQHTADTQNTQTNINFLRVHEHECYYSIFTSMKMYTLNMKSHCNRGAVAWHQHSMCIECERDGNAGAREMTNVSSMPNAKSTPQIHSYCLCKVTWFNIVNFAFRSILNVVYGHRWVIRQSLAARQWSSSEKKTRRVSSDAAEKWKCIPFISFLV